MAVYLRSGSAQERVHRMTSFSVQFLTVPGVVKDLIKPQPPMTSSALHTMMTTLKKISG